MVCAQRAEVKGASLCTEKCHGPARERLWVISLSQTSWAREIHPLPLGKGLRPQTLGHLSGLGCTAQRKTVPLFLQPFVQATLKQL